MIEFSLWCMAFGQRRMEKVVQSFEESTKCWSSKDSDQDWMFWGYRVQTWNLKPKFEGKIVKTFLSNFHCKDIGYCRPSKMSKKNEKKTLSKVFSMSATKKTLADALTTTSDLSYPWRHQDDVGNGVSPTSLPHVGKRCLDVTSGKGFSDVMERTSRKTPYVNI